MSMSFPNYVYFLLFCAILAAFRPINRRGIISLLQDLTRLVTLPCKSAVTCDSWVRFSRDIGNFLSLYWYSPLEICSNLWLLVWMCLLTDYFLLKSVTLTPTIQFWSTKCSLLNWKLYPKRVFSRLATAVSKKRNRTDPAKPTTIVKAGVDDSIVLPICMALNGDNGGYHERGALV